MRIAYFASPIALRNWDKRYLDSSGLLHSAVRQSEVRDGVTLFLFNSNVQIDSPLDMMECEKRKIRVCSCGTSTQTQKAELEPSVGRGKFT